MGYEEEDESGVRRNKTYEKRRRKMKKIKKMFAPVLIGTMLLGNIQFAMAEDAIVIDSNRITENNMIVPAPVYQSDIDAGNWNLELLNGETPDIYEDFPMRVESDYDRLANLKFHFTYLKCVSDSDTVNFVITDREDNSVIYQTGITEANAHISFENLAMEKTYNLTLSETLNGVSTTYSAVIVTKYKRPDFPGNANINSWENYENGITVNAVYVEAVNDNDDTTAQRPTRVEAANLPAYYDTLDSGMLYKVTATVVFEQASQRLEGFFSTASGERQRGIYIPGHSFYTEGQYQQLLNTPATLDYNHPMVTADEVGSTNLLYDTMKDISFSLNAEKYYIIVKYTFPETGTYTIRTFGNIGTAMEVWAPNSSGSYSYQRLVRGRNNNLEYQTTILGGEERRFVLYFDDNEYYSGKSIFSIKFDTYADDVSNSVYEVINSGVKAVSDTVISGEIDYGGDVDVYRIDNAIGGEYGVEFKNKANDGGKFNVYIGEIYTETPFETFKVIDFTVSQGATERITLNLSGSSTKYYIEVWHENKAAASQDYELEIISPYKADSHEPNNDTATATPLNETSGSMSDITLHKNDVDYFSFTTGAGGADLSASITAVNGKIYNMDLYQAGTTPTLVASGIKGSTENILSVSDLEPSTQYYICLNLTGMGNHAYSAVNYTTLTWNITNHAAPVEDKVEITNISFVEAINYEWDWAACAEMVANSRLAREGRELSTKSQFDAVSDILGDLELERVNLQKAAKAAVYFYTNGSQSGYSFVSSNNITTNNAQKFKNLISQGKAVILQLASPSNPTDMSLARYVVLCGVNMTNATYRIIDPQTGADAWVSQSGIHNGGYIQGSDIKFLGCIIEMQ